MHSSAFGINQNDSGAGVYSLGANPPAAHVSRRPGRPVGERDELRSRPRSSPAWSNLLPDPMISQQASVNHCEYAGKSLRVRINAGTNETGLEGGGAMIGWWESSAVCEEPAPLTTLPP